MGRILNDEIRSELKKPFGDMINIGNAGELLERVEGRIICVGDICSYEVVRTGVIPHIMIFDNLCLRKAVGSEIKQAIRRACGRTYNVKNSAGTISDEALSLIESMLDSREKGCIEVEGEEDLLALAAMIKCREGDAILYGQPGEGAVLVVMNKERIKKAKEIYERMDSE